MLLARFIILAIICSVTLRNNVVASCSHALHSTSTIDSTFDDDDFPPDDSDTPIPSEDENPLPSVSDWADEAPCPMLALPLIRTPSLRIVYCESLSSCSCSAHLLYTLQRLRI